MAAQGVVRWLEDLSLGDVALVGGKNASMGEMIRTLARKGVRVPGGFATVSQAYWDFLEANNLRTSIVEQIDALRRGADLAEVGATIREVVMNAEFPPHLEQGLRDAYRELGARLQRQDPDVAVRSSATSEDLPEASVS
jgi:pyruvate,water dikinase